MKTFYLAAAASVGLALPALAEGDAAAGEKEFRACKACHMIKSPDETIVRGGRVGPNLYGVTGETAGAAEDFRYSDLLSAANEQGVEWTEENFVAYVQDPTGWLKDTTGESGRGKMSYMVRDPQVARDVYAYLASLSE
jgi:cytochrome c